MSPTPDPDETVAFDVELDAPAARVWRALANPDVRAAWLGEPEPQSGQAEATVVEPGVSLQVRWPIEGRDTLITFEIAPAGRGTRLTVTHAPGAGAEVISLPVRTRGPTVMSAGFRRAA